MANAAWARLWESDGGVSGGANVFEDERLRAIGLTPHVENSVASGEAVITPPLLYDPPRVGRVGDARWLKAFVYPVRDETGRVLEVALMLEDITERKALEERLERQALHDPLTDLPNRTLLSDRLEHALARLERRGGRVAVLFADLDDFKFVNDSLGHEAGDRLLVEVTRRLKECVRPEDTVARFGGDEFAVLLEDVVTVGDATRVAERIAEELRAPIVLAGKEVFVTTSVGIALGGSAKERPADLLRNADLAMYEAKSGGRARYEVFAERMNTRALERLELVNDLERAVRREEFVIHYQPEVSLKTGKTVMAEALVRWERPGHGLVPPGEFVPVAEETGLIVPIGRWVLREACRQVKAWQREHGDPTLAICVNLSARQFQDPALAATVAQVLDETGLDPRCLCLEITESAAMKDAPATATALAELKNLGVRSAIDDFGTGYSSLSYLRSFPADYLKIDKSFVEGLDRHVEAGKIFLGIVTLARFLGIGVIAEGVETTGQLAKLRTLRCDLAQGYHLCKPCPGGAASEFLAAHR